MPKTSLRTNTCNDLTKKDINKEVTLCGWIHTRRDHGNIIFIDLRDRYGFTQIVFDPEFNKEIHKKANELRREDCIQVKGEVKERIKGMANPNLKTGEIEVFIEELNIFSKSKTPPFEIDDRIIPSEEVRLQYRFLDLRRPIMQKNLLFRQKCLQAARKYMEENKFIEIQTPLLVKPTPEGARDYIVPSRVNPGKFYALPQSPQLYKQILMISGFDRYFQLPAVCLRDEDLRADRQPEHSQLDFEMSFVNEQDIMDLVEGLMKDLVKNVLGKEIKEKFPILTYQESMDKYGNDKPDLRIPLELKDVTKIAKKSNFEVFKKEELIKCLIVPKPIGRKEIDSLIEFAQSLGAKGMAWTRYDGKALESSIVKYFSEKVQEELIKELKLKKDSIILFIADKEKKVNTILSELRKEVGKRLDLINKDELKFCWIAKFPLFEWNEEENKWDAMHHIFSHPTEDTLKHVEKNPEKVLGNLFDIVLNGTEMGSGSIRISDPKLQQQMFKVIGITKEEAEQKFGFLLNAYNYGGPVHGGMGLGFDRITAMLLGLNDIREVIAFPKNKAAQNPMDNSPNETTPKQLSELHIKVDIAKKK
ncbi:aspartate--tRNA ligase [Candidatus Woesearchaeota archaeon]|nr:aspartate--tRNA ligase [Candidatus Woesearchaeota archaeon]